MLERARVLYVTGFFLTHSPDAAIQVAKVAAARNIPFVMNISAPFLVFVEIFRERVLALLEYADYVFCNHHEAEALGQVMGWGSDLLVIARKTAALPKKNGARARRVIFTHGGEPALLVGGDATEPVYHAPIKLAEKELVDENGAGDAYVGGFLSALSKGKSLDECFASAAYCAWVVIRRVGCSVPEQEGAEGVCRLQVFCIKITNYINGVLQSINQSKERAERGDQRGAGGERERRRRRMRAAGSGSARSSTARRLHVRAAVAIDDRRPPSRPAPVFLAAALARALARDDDRGLARRRVALLRRRGRRAAAAIILRAAHCTSQPACLLDRADVARDVHVGVGVDVAHLLAHRPACPARRC
jgi:hypothetical protein